MGVTASFFNTWNIYVYIILFIVYIYVVYIYSINNYAILIKKS